MASHGFKTKDEFGSFPQTRSVEQHYAEHLAPIYVWMVGGIDAALAAGAADLSDIAQKPGFAVDLGAGFGMHALPLARAGHRVLAIDSSRELLARLRDLAVGLPIEIRCGDLLAFPDHLANGEKADLILCMGDTLTHLQSRDAIAALAASVAHNLQGDGRFVATFRDYSRLPQGEQRFIPVRSDETRILTCFLEEMPEHVCVHDILHERLDGSWTTKVSSYRKLEIAPEEVRTIFEAAGLAAKLSPGPRGMLRLSARA